MKGRNVSAAAAAILMAGCAGTAYAADLGMPTKALPAPGGPAVCTGFLDFITTACQLSAYGVRFYGTLDLGATYETHGSKMDPNLGVNSFLSKMSNRPQFILAPNGLSASNIGLQIKEPLGAGWSFIGQVEAGFNPLSGHLLNGVHSVFDAIGTPLANQTAFGDSNSQGQFYNDLGFTGVSHDTWGTLTFFRQNDLMQDAILSYDPLGVSGAFSPLGFFGGFAGGGDTQNRRDTTAIKYRVNYANWHFGAYAQVGGYEEGNAARGSYSGDVGTDIKLGAGLLSVDAIGQFRKDAVALGAGLAGQVDQNGFPININQGGTLFNGAAINTLASTLSNNTSAMLVAKYQVDRLKLYAGWEWIQFKNPSDPIVGNGNGFTDIAGDFLCVNCQQINGTNINSTNFTSGTEFKQLAWFGARYSLTDSLDVAAAYYHEWQNDFSGGAKNANQAGQPALTCAQSSTSGAKCAGTKDTVSAVLDWKFAPKWDTYIGVNWDRNTGGDLNGYLHDQVVTSTAGVRFRW